MQHSRFATILLARGAVAFLLLTAAPSATGTPVVEVAPSRDRATAREVTLDGMHEVLLRLWDAAEGGNEILADDQGPVPIVLGSLRVIFGGGTPPGTADPEDVAFLDGALFAGGPAWLEVVLDRQPLAPRLRLDRDRDTGSLAVEPRTLVSDAFRLLPAPNCPGRSALCFRALHNFENGRIITPDLDPSAFARARAEGDEGEPQEETPGLFARRAEWLERRRLGPLDRIPDGALASARKYRDALVEQLGTVWNLDIAQQTVPGDTWVDLGPAPLIDGRGIANSGRIRAIAVDPSDESGNTIYVGAASGGVWKTTDGGTEWVPLTDFQDSLATNSIALDPQDPRIVYVGTGELSIRYGAGILKSIDGGRSWTALGQSVFGTGEFGAAIPAIALDPTPVANPQEQRVIHVASSQGVFRSPDGGRSWKCVLRGRFSDLVIDPTDPAVVYAAQWGVGIWRSGQSGASASWNPIVDQNGSLPTTQFGRIDLAIVEHPETSEAILFASMEDLYARAQLKGIWKTEDDGAHWIRLAGHPAEFGQGSFTTPGFHESEPNGSFGTADVVMLGSVTQGTIASSSDVDVFRVNLTGTMFGMSIMADRAGTGLDPQIGLYNGSGQAVLDPDGRPMIQTSGFAGSKDERRGMEGWNRLVPGTYYVRVESQDGSTGAYQLSLTGADVGCNCWYDQVLAVDPEDPDRLYVGLVRLHRSSDGGRNWTDIGDHGGTNAVHSDMHAIAFDPQDSRTVYVGTDGGLFKSPNRGDGWESLNTNLSITQPYPGMAQHPDHPGLVFIGTQDNGVLRWQNGVWTEVQSGDGAACLVEDFDHWYTSVFGLQLRRTEDGGQTFPAIVGLGKHDVATVAPLAMAPGLPWVLLAGGGHRVNDQTQHAVYKSGNRGAQWFPDSPDLGGQITALAFSPQNLDVYYAGTSDGRIWRTVTGGGPQASQWEELMWFGQPRITVTDLAVAPDDPYVVYATYPSFGLHHVWRLTKQPAGILLAVPVSTPQVGTPLPDLPTHAIVIDPVFPQTIFVGNDIGVWRTIDGGINWYPFDFGLPNTRVTDLVLSPNAGPGGKLRASTYGRGVWELRTGNDHCENATEIGNGYHRGTTKGATADGYSRCGSADGSPDVWYRYTATCTGEIRVNTCGSQFDTVVSIHADECPGVHYNQLDCNASCGGDPCGAPFSCASADVVAGESYLIRVAGSNGAAGGFGLSVSCVVPNDFCEEAAELAPTSSTAGSTEGAALDTAPTCSEVPAGDAGVWYEVVGTGNTITASLCNQATTFDTRLSVYCGGCGGRTCVAASDDTCGADGQQSRVAWCSAPGRIYHLLVHGAPESSGPFHLELSDDGVSCGPYYLACSPANDRCASAKRLHGLGVRGDNTEATTDGAASCAPSNSDVWYEFNPGCHGFVTFDTCDSTGDLDDTVLSVLDTCEGHEIACNDDAEDCGLMSSVTVVESPADPLSVRLAGYGGTPQGSFNISVSHTVMSLDVVRAGFFTSDGDWENEDHLFRFDPLGPFIINVGPLGRSGIAALAYAPGLGLLYGVEDSIDEDALVTIDVDTGEALLRGPVGFSAVRGLAWDPARNVLYGVDTATDQLLIIDPWTGAGTAVGGLGYSGVEGLAFDPDSATLYGSDIDTDRLLVINTVTGQATAVGPFGGNFDRIEGLTWHPQDHRLYGIEREPGSGDGRTVIIDTTTGTASQTGPTFTAVGANSLAIVPGLPNSTEGRPYDATIPVAGGCPPYRFSEIAGLPPGLVADETGRITGVPWGVGSYRLDFAVFDHDISTPGIEDLAFLRVRPGNDSCANAFVARDGETELTTHLAATDGPDEPAMCDWEEHTNVKADVWYCYTAACSGILWASLCESNFDNKLAVYEGCGCPDGPSAIACNDDSCGWGAELEIPVVAGQEYLLRVGSRNDTHGEALLRLECYGAPAGACCTPGHCAVVDEGECAAKGGIYLGDGIPCAPDSDGDGVVDECDACLADPLKSKPGVCGCGQTDFDSDADGEPDCVDPDDDGDGVEDADDVSPSDRFSCEDSDRDGCDDCSLGWRNPAGDGIDFDSDGACDIGDCDDEDPSVHPGAHESNDGRDNNCPGDDGYELIDEISGVAGFHTPGDKSAFSWPVQPNAVFYLVARSTLPTFAGDCTRRETEDPFWQDLAIPESGGVFHYLVRSLGPHLGSWGRDSTAQERTMICP